MSGKFRGVNNKGVPRVTIGHISGEKINDKFRERIPEGF